MDSRVLEWITAVFGADDVRSTTGEANKLDVDRPHDTKLEHGEYGRVGPRGNRGRSANGCCQQPWSFALVLQFLLNHMVSRRVPSANNTPPTTSQHFLSAPHHLGFLPIVLSERPASSVHFISCTYLLSCKVIAADQTASSQSIITSFNRISSTSIFCKGCALPLFC